MLMKVVPRPEICWVDAPLGFYLSVLSQIQLYFSSTRERRRLNEAAIAIELDLPEPLRDFG